MRDKSATCVRAEDAPLIIGQSAPASGANQELGTGMKLGIELAFKEQNDDGGVRGRQLKLEFRDDAYQPDLAEAAARRLLDVQVSTSQAATCPSTSAVSATALTRGPNAVLAILGNVGTPTMVRSAPVAIETGTVFFGAFTGASTLLRDGMAGTCGRYVFNVRASYAQEAKATLEYFLNRNVVGHKHLISFDQRDSFGQSGYDGLIAAYKEKVGAFPAGTDSTTPFFRVRYIRDVESSVPDQVAATQSYLMSLVDPSIPGNPTSGIVPIGILMTDTYGAGSTYIQALRTWQFTDDGQLAAKQRLRLLFSNVSFVGANALADRLKAAGKIPGSANSYFTEDVVISQVVPNYQSDQSQVVQDYNSAIAASGAKPSFTSLEGYIAARVFIAGLLDHEGPFTASSIVDTLERLPDLGLGFGATSGFEVGNHQYSNSVWGTILTPDGTFKNLYFWNSEFPIQFFE